MSQLLRIAERVLNRPLLLHPDKVPLLLAVLEGRIPVDAAGRAGLEERLAGLPADARAVIEGPLRPEANRFVGSGIKRDPMTGKTLLPYSQAADGTALIPVIGSLVHRGAWLGPSSGMTSYEGLQYQVAAALADPGTPGILFDISSPGGEATGAFEMAAAVRAASAVKPTVAVVNGMAASAAYAIASGARKIVATESSVAGSIGVLLVHADYSRALDKQGVTPTIIFAGAHKVDGNPFEPLPESVRADLQREVNQLYDMFVQTVAAGRRGISPAAIRDTEARVFIGAEAVQAGLVDELGSFESALADLSALSRGQAQAAGRPTSTKEKTRMDNTQGAPAAGSAGISEAEHKGAVDKARAEGKAEGVTEGAKTERERILGIQAAAFAGQEKLVADLIQSGASLGDAALALNKAQKEKATAHIDALRAADSRVAGVTSTATADGDRPDPREAGRKAVEKASDKDVATRAQRYQDEMAAKGHKVTTTEAVDHVTREIAAGR